jgi:flagellar biosynthesis protein FlhG
MNDKLYIRTGKKQYGPINLADFRRLVRNGKITADDFVFHAYQNSWVKLGEVEKFSAIFAENGVCRKASRVVAVGGGKGGVGKTAIISSMAYELSTLGKKVIIVDADFSGPNIHKWIGPTATTATLYHYFTEPALHLRDIVQKTQFPNLEIICGAALTLRSSNPMYLKRVKFKHHLHELDADIVLVDLSPGITYTNVDIFLSCDEGIVITVPEPTAILDTYNFIRIALLRQIRKSLAFSRAAIEVVNVYERSVAINQDYSLTKIYPRIERVDPQAFAILEGLLKFFNVRFVFNMVWNAAEVKEASYFKNFLMDTLGIETDFLGFITYNKFLRKTARDKRPFIFSKTNGFLKLSQQVEKTPFSIFKNFIKTQLDIESKNGDATSITDTALLNHPCSNRQFHYN